MRPRPRCSIPDAAVPRPVSSGPMPAMTAPGADPIRRRRLCLRSRSQGRAADGPSRRLHRRAAGGRYGGYQPLAEKGQVQLAFCWAHVRRRFYELAAAGPAPIASEALERIKALYAIEAEIRGLEADVRKAVRQEKSLPLILELEPWLRAKLATISQKTSSQRPSATRSRAGRASPSARTAGNALRCWIHGRNRQGRAERSGDRPMARACGSLVLGRRGGRARRQPRGGRQCATWRYRRRPARRLSLSGSGLHR